MTIKKIDFSGLTCPIQFNKNEKVMLGHGSGGIMSQKLIRDIFLNAFNNPILNKGNDAGYINDLRSPISVSTDAHVVYPLFFPGGDIGKLADGIDSTISEDGYYTLATEELLDKKYAK